MNIKMEDVQKSRMKNFEKRERGSVKYFEESNVDTFNTPFGGLYMSCAALTSFSGTFDLILFQAVNFEFNVAYSTDTQKLNNYLILI